MNGKRSAVVLQERKKAFDPYRLVNDEEFNTNLNAIIAYYQMTKGEVKQRFVSSR